MNPPGSSAPAVHGLGAAGPTPGETHSADRHPPSSLASLGEASRRAWRDLLEQIAFLGAVVVALGEALRRPRRLRLGEVVSLAHAAGVEALAIVGLVNFLIGLIIAFIGGQILATFGAQVFVADAIGIIMVRELGPIMTAILVAGRTGSAFAAELGTMRVNEEIDALATMGLSPVPLLVLPRVLAGTIATPILSLYGMLAGIAAGLLQMAFLGFPLAVSRGRLEVALSSEDLVIGVTKSIAFGFLVTAIGCLRGLQAARGPRSVGLAATRAVVAGIVLVIVVDALFAAVTTALGI